MKPTKEQDHVVEVFQSMQGTNKKMKVNAFAGATKTTTLEFIANSTSSPGVYLCFNKPIAEEASKRFPTHIDCRTTHSFAYRAMIRTYQNSGKWKMTGSLRARDTADLLRLKALRVFGGTDSLEPSTLGYAINQTIGRFCMSADAEIDKQHFANIPKFKTLPEDEFFAVRTKIIDWSRQVWAEMLSPLTATPLGFSGYLKAWQLSNPIIDTCYVLLDEAQDTAPVMLDVLSKQDCQIVYVGDKYQQIYEWRGAINAMELAHADVTCYLTKSFRFGQAIADYASEILATIGEKVRIVGNEAIDSSITAEHQNTILSRTNAEILSTILRVHEEEGSKKIHVVGGVEDLSNCIEGIQRLQAKKASGYPAFIGFDNWQDYLIYVEKSGDSEAEKIVSLTEKYEILDLQAALAHVLPSAHNADILLTTAHKSKGREWSGVELAEDFGEQPHYNKETKEWEYDASESRLFYVAATRAINKLKVPEWALQYKAIEKKESVDKPRAVAPSTAPNNLDVGNFMVQAAAAEVMQETTLRALEGQGHEVIRHTATDASIIVPQLTFAEQMKQRMLGLK